MRNPAPTASASDEGYCSRAQIAGLKDLSLASRNISEAGLGELASLRNLRRLAVSAKISAQARA
ncbi:MAG: hypothetical protein WD872_08105 [Pirellulaceae bacterium]